MAGKNASGFIETRGYLTAVAAADVCLKSANVNLIGLKNVRCGLFTVIINGDVGAVKAAITAGTAVAETIGKVLSSHVIPRPGEGISELLHDVTLPEKTAPTHHTEEFIPAPVISDAEPKESDSVQLSSQEKGRMTEEELYACRTVDLRKMARGMKGIDLSGKKIKYARKNELVKAILTCWRQDK